MKKQISIALASLLIAIAGILVGTPSSARAADGEAREAVVATEARDDCVATNLDASNCQIIEYINTVFNIVSAVIVLAVIGNIVYAGIRYSTSQGDPGGAGAAKKRIRDAVGAFIMYLLLYGFIQWLVPGGVF